MPLNYPQVKKLYESHAPHIADQLVREVFTEDRAARAGFDFGRLFEECFGWENFRHLRENSSRPVSKVFEAAGATSTAAFIGTSGQFIYSTFMEKYMLDEFVFKNTIPSVQTPFNGEKIPGVTQLGDEGDTIGEAKPYPIAGVSEDYIETPETTKRGLITPITREAIFFSRTGLEVERISEVATGVGLRQEKEAIDAVIDQNRTKHRHKWKGTSYATYQASTPWVNLATSRPLVDEDSVNALEILLGDMTDPNTGEPIIFPPKHVIVTNSLLFTIRRILKAVETRKAAGGYPTSGNPLMTVAPKVIDDYEILTSRMLKARLAAASRPATDWFIGDVTKAVKYMENWGMEVTTAPAGSEDEFKRDIVMQYKASRRGEYVVVQPRLLAAAQA